MVIMNPKPLHCLALVLSCGLNCHAAIIYPKAPVGGKQICRNILIHNFSNQLGITNVADLTITDQKL